MFRPFRSTVASAAQSRPPILVDDIPIFDGQLADAIDTCASLLARGEGARIATANLDFLALARRDGTLKQNLRRSSLVVADGMPVVWLARLAGGQRVKRIAGVDLVEALCRRGGPHGTLRIAIYGSTEAVTEPGGRHLEDIGNVRVVASINPPFRPLSDSEREAHLAALVGSQPDVVLVALGCPTQEQLIADWHKSLPAALWIGVGGTFDFFGGRRKRAPRAFRASGLEWVVRLAQEPRRLGRRYLGRDVPALLAIAPKCVAQRWRSRSETN